MATANASSIRPHLQPSSYEISRLDGPSLAFGGSIQCKYKTQLRFQMLSTRFRRGTNWVRNGYEI